MNPEQPTRAIDAREVLAARRALGPRRSVLQQAEVAYLAVLTTGILGLLLMGAWRSLGSFILDFAHPYQALLGAPLLFLVCLAVLRFCTWQGFASFSEADCAHLLTAPVPRHGLVWPRLRSAGLLLGIVGAAIAVVILEAAGVRPVGVARIVGAAAAGFAVGVSLVGAGWQVQRLPRLSVWVLRLTLPALAVAGVLVLGDRAGGAARLAVLWSGPWGWGLLPSVSTSPAPGLAALALLGGAGALAWVSMRRTAGDCTLEGLRARARTRSRMVAGLYTLDARAIVTAPRRARTTRWRSRLHLPTPRHPVLAVPWRSALALLRSPARLAWGAALAGGAVLLLASAPDQPGTLAGGALALYLAAGSLLEPLRLDADAPSTAQILLPWSYGTVLWRHCAVPGVVVVTMGALALVGGRAAGVVGAAVLPSFGILLVPLAAVAVLAAALSARRGGRMPTNILLLTAGDPTGAGILIVVAWTVGWALLAIVSVAVAVGTVIGSGAAPAQVGNAAVVLLVIAAVLRSMLVASRS